MRTPKQAKLKLQKNIERSSTGDRLGRVHMERQDFNEVRRSLALWIGKAAYCSLWLCR